MSSNEAAFSVGQLVRHRLFGYRGVVYDVDASFLLSDEWYEQVARSRPPKDRPWYHVLVDTGSHTTYVAQRNLEADESSEPIDHPLVPQLFGRFREGRYEPGRKLN